MNDRKVIKQIIKESLGDPKDKKYHVNHFVFDFRQMVINNIIRKQLQDSNQTRKDEFSLYDIQYLIRRITKKFGKDIENYATLRAIIDD